MFGKIVPHSGKRFPVDARTGRNEDLNGDGQFGRDVAQFLPQIARRDFAVGQSGLVREKYDLEILFDELFQFTGNLAVIDLPIVRVGGEHFSRLSRDYGPVQIKCSYLE